MTYIPGPKSQSALTKARSLFPGGVNSPVRAFGPVDVEPFVVAYGEGPYLVDVDGKRYIDYINSWGPLVLGHAAPKVVEAVSEQAAKGTSYGATCELETQLGELVQSLVPNLEMLRFVNSGTEAGMSVLRLARGYTGRSKILKFAGCYHGHADSLLVKAGSGVATLSLPGTAGVSELVAQDTLVAEFNDLNQVEDIFKKYADQIAAVVLEPVAGNAGLIKPQPEFLPGLRSICDEYSSLLIFDEVMTGFRVSLGGAQGLFNVKPDLSMFGKVIGGGLPVGAFGGRREIMEHLAPLGPVYQAGTLSGNPLAMIAGYTTLSLWSQAGSFEQAQKDAITITQALKESATSNNIPLYTDTCGSMFGFFFQEGPVTNYSEAQKSDLAMFNSFFSECLKRGVYFAQSPYEAGFTSAAHAGNAIDETVKIIAEVFDSLGSS